MTGKSRAWWRRLCAGSVVTGNAPLRPEQLQCDDRSPRVHGEVSTDRQNGDVRFVHSPEQLHVAEDASVAGEIELEPVLQLDHVAARRATVAAIGRAARVPGVCQRDLDPFDDDRPTLVGAQTIVPL